MVMKESVFQRRSEYDGALVRAYLAYESYKLVTTTINALKTVFPEKWDKTE